MKVFVSKDEIKWDPTMTISQVKDYIRKNGYDVETAELYFSDGQKLSPVVFQTNQYDNMNFMSHASVLPGSRLLVKESQKPPMGLPAIGLPALPTLGMQPMIPVPTNKLKYYVLVDTHYEGPDIDNFFPDVVAQLPITMGQEKMVEDIVAIAGRPTKPQYNDVFNKISNLVRSSNIRKQWIPRETPVYNPIFLTENIEAYTISEISYLVKQLDYCEIWGNGMKITKYDIEPGSILVHLELTDTEAG